jgi:hypothetical protein
MAWWAAIPVSNDTAAVKVQQIGKSMDSRKFYECFEADDRFGIDESKRAVALWRSRTPKQNYVSSHTHKALEKIFFNKATNNSIRLWLAGNQWSDTMHRMDYCTYHYDTQERDRITYNPKKILIFANPNGRGKLEN